MNPKHFSGATFAHARSLFGALALVSLGGCSDGASGGASAEGKSTAASHEVAAAPAAESAGERCPSLMEPVISALWESAPAAFEGKFGTKVVLVKQSYDLGGGDSLYVLGPPQTSEISDRGEFSKLVATLSARAGERDDESIPNVRTATGTAWDATFVKEAGVAVADTERCAVTVDVGDVEHVLLAAFARQGDELRALYYN